MKNILTVGSKLSVIWRYGLSVILVVIALVLTYLMQKAFSIPFWFLFLAAIMVSTWFSGKGAGIFAVILSTLVVDYYFTPPLQTLSFAPENLPFVLQFILAALATGWVSSLLQEREHSLRMVQSELEMRVKERTAELENTNETLEIGRAHV